MLVIMKLKNLTNDDLTYLAEKIKCNAEHLRKIARGARPCSKRLAEQIEIATNGLFKKAELLWPDG